MKRALFILGIFALGSIVSAKSLLTVLSPTDKSLYVVPGITLAGVVNDPRIATISINGESMRVYNQRFSTTVLLKTGRNELTVQAQLQDRVETVIKHVIYRPALVDVGPVHPNKKAIDDLITLGLMSPYEDGSFRPSKTVERAEFAAALVFPEPLVSANTGFRDVPKSYWAASAIKEVVQKGYMKPLSKNRFGPGTWMTRRKAIQSLRLLTPSADVSAKITRPNDWLTRGEFAEMLMTVPSVIKQVDALYSW